MHAATPRVLNKPRMQLYFGNMKHLLIVVIATRQYIFFLFFFSKKVQKSVKIIEKISFLILVLLTNICFIIGMLLCLTWA